jgi:hypothetical protein
VIERCSTPVLRSWRDSGTAINLAATRSGIRGRLTHECRIPIRWPFTLVSR